MPLNGTLGFILSFMAKGSLKDKKRRQDELLSCLRSQSYWTTKALCQQLSTSQRTLMRDLAELKESGIPIDSDRGRGGGIRLDGRWGLGRLQMSNAEVISLLLALVIAETVNSPLLLDNLTSIKNRISASFPFEQRQKIEELRSRIQVGGSASNHVMGTYQAPNDELMPVISQCFIERKMLEIEYYSNKKEVTTRVIEPQMFFLNWPVWYLLSWDELRQDIRLFRVDRIRAAKKRNQSFVLRKREFSQLDWPAFFAAL